MLQTFAFVSICPYPLWRYAVVLILKFPISALVFRFIIYFDLWSNFGIEPFYAKTYAVVIPLFARQ